MIRRAIVEESDDVARVFRVSRDAALPYLPKLHTLDEDRAFFRERVFAACDVRVAVIESEIVGFCAFRDGWIDHLYVLPSYQGAGIGTALLAEAIGRGGAMRLWTFRRNERARRFYEAHGFRLERVTDGDNEEREPDVLYVREPTAAER